MLFFDKKLEKVFDLFDKEFYDNIQLPNKIDEFIKNKDEKKWDIITEKDDQKQLSNNEEKEFEELSFCSNEEIDQIILKIIDKLDDTKKCNF